MARPRWRTDAAHPLSLVRSARRGRVPLRRAGRRCLSRRPRAAVRPRVEPLPVLSRQSARRLAGAVGAPARLPPLVHRRPRHRFPRVQGGFVRRLSEGGAIDRSRTLTLRWDGRELPAHPGDTLASALLAAGEVVVARSTVDGRPRGVFSAGDEEPNAFVELEAPARETMTAAPLVEAVDGLAARPLA